MRDGIQHPDPRHGKPRPRGLKMRLKQLKIKLKNRIPGLTGMPLGWSGITMFDSVTVGSLPAGAAAYAGYVGGYWPTFDYLRATFPHADLLSVAVGAGEVADCLDVETGDASVGQAPGWLNSPSTGDVLYASASNVQAVIDTLAYYGRARSSYKVWSAHYIGYHICGPGTCGYPQADGTQYTQTAYGRNLDQSILDPDFFAVAPAPPKPPAPPAPQEEEDDEMLVPPATDVASQVPVGKSFPSAGAYSTMGFMADPNLAGAPSTSLRVAFHLVGGGWSVQAAVVIGNGAGAKTVITVPDNADGVSITRNDTVGVAIYPNFGA